jgi:hypothetical protein
MRLAKAVAVAAAVLVPIAAGAARKTVVIAVGDCQDPGLLTAARDFQELARPQLGAELLEPELVLRTVRPQAGRGVPELERQVEAARALLYSGENERGLDVVQDAIAELERASPVASPGPVLVRGLLLQAQLFRNLDRLRESAEAHRKVLRVEPGLRLDADQFPPSTLQAFDAVRRELLRGRRGTLLVEVIGEAPAAVFVDGREVGQTGQPLELPQGSYRVELVQANRVSFAHKVSVGRHERLRVDLDFEGSVAARAPLCVAEEHGAQRLASAVAAQRVVVVRDGAGRGNPPYWLGTLYEVRTTERVRNGGVRADQLRDLMLYLFTGKPELPAPPPVAAAPAPPPAPGPPLVEREPADASPARAREVELAPLAPGPAAAPAGRSEPTARVVSSVALGLGAALVASGVAAYLIGGDSRGRLAALRAGSGRLPDPGTAAYTEALTRLHEVDANLTLSLTLAGCGVGAALGGLLGLLLFPAQPVTLGAAPLVQGAQLTLTLPL